MWMLGIGNIEKLHCVVAWLLGGRAVKERPGAIGMSWLGMPIAILELNGIIFM
jgi:hypothetical protein